MLTQGKQKNVTPEKKKEQNTEYFKATYTWERKMESSPHLSIMNERKVLPIVSPISMLIVREHRL